MDFMRACYPARCTLDLHRASTNKWEFSEGVLYG